MSDQILATVFQEAGVQYFRIQYPHFEKHPFKAVKCEYTKRYLGASKRTQLWIEHVYLEDPKDLDRLLTHWSRFKTWDYQPVKE